MVNNFLAMTSFESTWANYRFVAFGEFPTGDLEPENLFFSEGRHSKRRPVEDVDLSEIAEYMKSASLNLLLSLRKSGSVLI
jgi:hypothetical protein